MQLLTDIEVLRGSVETLPEREAAFARIVRAFQDMAFGYAYALTGDAHLAEDACQEAFLQVWQDLPTLRAPAAFPAWLKRIVHSRCRRMTRGKRPQTMVLTDNVEGDQADLAETIGRQETQAELWRAMRELPEHERVTTVLFYLDELPGADVARFLGISPNTVKQRLFSARQRLQGAMAEQVQALLQRQRPSRDDAFLNLVRMLVAVRCSAQSAGEGLEIAVRRSNGGFAVTPAHYQVPLRIDLVAKTDSTNIRLRFARGQVILNWEWFADELRWWDPATGLETGVPGQGCVPAHTWVYLTWIIEPGWAELRVNGEVRHRSEGQYAGLAGQVGIGAAHGSVVTVRSFRVAGPRVATGIPIREPLRFEADHGVVAVPHAQHAAAVRWYCEHLGLQFKIADEIPCLDGPVRVSYLEFPGGKGLNIKSPGPEGPDRERTRLTFATPNRPAALAQLGGPLVEGLFQGPCGAVHELHEDPGAAALFRPAPWRVGARDLQAAAAWYQRYLGIGVEEDHTARGYLVMTGGFHMQRLPPQAFNTPPTGPTQPHFLVREIEAEHRRLSAAGVETSALRIGGDGRWKSFYFYDQDGNQLHAWRWD